MSERNENSLQTGVRWGKDALWIGYGAWLAGKFLGKLVPKPSVYDDIEVRQIVHENIYFLKKAEAHFDCIREEIDNTLADYVSILSERYPEHRNKVAKWSPWLAFESGRVQELQTMIRDYVLKPLSHLQFPTKAQAAKRDKMLAWIADFDAKYNTYLMGDRDKAKAEMAADRKNLKKYLAINGYLDRRGNLIKHKQPLTVGGALAAIPCIAFMAYVIWCYFGLMLR